MTFCQTVESNWDWFFRVKTFLATRTRVVSATKTALMLVDSSRRGSLVKDIERQIAEIDDHAVYAEHLATVLDDASARLALARVARNLDRLSVQLSGLIIPYASASASLRALR